MLGLADNVDLEEEVRRGVKEEGLGLDLDFVGSGAEEEGKEVLVSLC